MVNHGPAAQGRQEEMDRILKALAWLGSPLPGLEPPQRLDLLPGSPRPYRQGWHQGVDLYPQGRRMEFRSVRAAGDGWVVRADRAYVEMTPDFRAGLLARQDPDGGGNPEDLDRLHGRQVWILHNEGVLTRYSHLSFIQEGVERGRWLAKGEVLGRMGNSGTSAGAEGLDEDVHLHFEIHLPQGPFWEKLSPGQMKDVLAEVFGR